MRFSPKRLRLKAQGYRFGYSEKEDFRDLQPHVVASAAKPDNRIAVEKISLTFVVFEFDRSSAPPGA
jgi:hypothetical protein